jgi:catechol 2,3-dioxygenase-like lactoylglutathione lyase family enzyme
MIPRMDLVAFAPATDLDRARAFYVDVLGLTEDSRDQFACVLRSGEVMLRVTPVGPFTPQPFTVLGWAVTDLGTEMSRLVAAGVVFARFEGLDQDAAGVWTAPGGARIAWFHDPDGNVLSLTQHVP